MKKNHCLSMPDAISNPTGNFLAPFRANSGHLLQPFGGVRDDFDRFSTKVFDQPTRQLWPNTIYPAAGKKTTNAFLGMGESGGERRDFDLRSKARVGHQCTCYRNCFAWLNIGERTRDSD